MSDPRTPVVNHSLTTEPSNTQGAELVAPSHDAAELERLKAILTSPEITDPLDIIEPEFRNPGGVPSRRRRKAGRQAGELSGWISIGERLPEQRDKPYQVIAICQKTYDDASNYAGLGVRSVVQDWVVRKWPQNFRRWMSLPPEPAALAPIAMYYMRDNHTFKRLEGSIDEMIATISVEFDFGYTCGMLCSERPGFKDVHAHGLAKRQEFLDEARAALAQAQKERT